jgi:antitoxin component of MazEF toxin-antitoxin module
MHQVMPLPIQNVKVVTKRGNGLALTLTEELHLIGASEGSEVLVEADGEKVSIRRVHEQQ